VTCVVRGFFPLDELLHLGEHGWSPATIELALRLGVEIPSFRRAAEAFRIITHLPLSKSTLQRLAQDTGQQLVTIQAEEADAMVRIPSKEDQVVYRPVPKPDSEIMNVSSDGVLLRIREEGWKEVKLVTISAVEQKVNARNGESQVHLSQHSYRAGLWETKSFANHLWAEACRRGVERAKLVVSVNDGAAWIWAIVAMCFAHCVQILDWWHAVQYLWTIAQAHFDQDSAAATLWVEQQKRLLAASQLHLVFANVRCLYPRHHPLPDAVRKSIVYLFHQRWRMRYQEFRQAGCPIGSGSVESACKVVVQQRMKQAGMQWSPPGAQAMLALRCALLSDRWHLVQALLHPS
jgi:hypothetical protein